MVDRVQPFIAATASARCKNSSMVIMQWSIIVKLHTCQCETSQVPLPLCGVKFHTMNFGERLNTLMTVRGFNQNSLAKACGFGETAIRDLIKGTAKEPLGSRLYKIASVLDVRMEDILGEPRLVADMDGTEYNEEPVEETSRDIVLIPEYDVQLAAGAGTYANGDVIKDTWPFSRRFLNSAIRGNVDQLSVVEVVGDSMTPILQPQDRIIVNHSDTNPSPPGIFALWDGYGLVVKKVQRIHKSDPEKIMLISENSSYPAYEVLVDEVTIIGRVVWFSRKM